METYNIVRFYFNNGNTRRRVVESSVTLEQAQEHCGSPETSSKTCTSKEGCARTRKHGPWFDGYEKER